MSPLHLILDDHLKGVRQHHPDARFLTDYERKLIRRKRTEGADGGNAARLAILCLAAFLCAFILLGLAHK